MPIDMKRFWKFVVRHWRRLALLSAGAIIACAALLSRLASLAPVLSPSEMGTLGASTNWHTIIGHPLDLPLKLLLWISSRIPTTHQVVFTRLPSVILAILALLIFTYILRRWYGRRTMLFGFIIFATSTWFLHVGRFTGVEIEYLLGILTLLVVHIGLYDHELPLMIWIWALANLTLLFIPGMIWFVLLSLIWQAPQLSTLWQHYFTDVRQRACLIILSLAALAIPVVNIFRHPHEWVLWLGLPATLSSWPTYTHNLTNTVLAIFYRAPHNPELWLAQLPILDVFMSIMLLGGIAFYIRHWRATRTRLLFSYALLGIVLVSLGGEVRLSVIVPILYIVAVGGIAYLLYFWMQVFPRNPLARGLGIALVSSTIALSCFYNTWQYFVAWPHNPDTAQIYHHTSQRLLQ